MSTLKGKNCFLKEHIFPFRVDLFFEGTLRTGEQPQTSIKDVSFVYDGEISTKSIMSV